MPDLILPQERTLDWVLREDPRSANYPARALFRHAEPMNMSWRTPPIPLDQGREGACVGHGWLHEALTTPVRVDIARIGANIPRNPNDFASYIYRQAQRIDEWEGEDYEGTSVLAGAKVMRELGLLKEFRWAHSTRDAALSLTNIGPLVIGIPWYESMYEAPGGHVEIRGEVVGGHCLLVPAYRKAGIIYDEPAFGFFNSWGPSWGRQGFAWIRQSYFAHLISGGEVCVPTRRSYGR